MTLVERGLYERAYQEAEYAWRTRPEGLESYAHELISTALFTGRYREAERYSVTLLSQPGHEWSQNYLRLSLAIAMQGRLYPGQAAYVGNTLREAVGESKAEYSTTSFKDPSSVRETALASILAIATDSSYAIPYCEWALRLDPKCDLAARKLIVLYEATQRLDRAKELATSMVRVLPRGTARGDFEDHLRRLQAHG